MKTNLTCEHPGCDAEEGVRDYRRIFPEDLDPDGEGPLSKNELEDWRDEPIALCPQHAGTREPL